MNPSVVPKSNLSFGLVVANQADKMVLTQRKLRMGYVKNHERWTGDQKKIVLRKPT